MEKNLIEVKSEAINYLNNESKTSFRSIRRCITTRSEKDIFKELIKGKPEDIFDKGLKYGNLKAIKYAVEKHGLNPDGSWKSNNKKNWPLYLVVERRYEDIVKYFIDNGVSPDIKPEVITINSTPLLINTNFGNEKIFDILAKNIKDLSYPNNWPLHKASVNGHVGIVKKLLKDKNVINNLYALQTPDGNQTYTLKWINRMIGGIKNGVKKKVRIEDLLEIKKLLEDAQKN